MLKLVQINMFCKSCGSRIDDDSVFCSFCGMKQSAMHKPRLNSHASFEQVNVQDQQVGSLRVIPIMSAPAPEIEEASQPGYDVTYKKEIEATITGAIFFLASCFLMFFLLLNFKNIEANHQFRTYLIIGAVLLRIIVVAWIINIARRQNRNTFGWILFAFLLPSFALIVIGLLKKLNVRFGINEGLSAEENSKILCKRAETFLKKKRYYKSIVFAEKAIELDPANESAADVLTKARLEISIDEIPDKKTQIVLRETKDHKILKIISENYQPIGADVLIGNTLAPNGEYAYLRGRRRLIVKNGKIVNILH